jgi:hypothetical protein
MHKELDAESYKLTFEKIASGFLAAICAWFCFWDIDRGNGLLWIHFGAFKLSLFVLSATIGVRIFGKGILAPALLCGLIASIYNPVFRLDLDYRGWKAILLTTGLIYAWITCRLCRITEVMTPDRIQRMRLAEARAKALDEASKEGTLDDAKYHHFVSKLKGGDTTSLKQSIIPLSPEQRITNSPSVTEQVIHFVLKYPPTGVPSTKNNTLVTGKAARTVDGEGKRGTTIKTYAGSDPLTPLEARSAFYWRDQIEGGMLTDAQVIEWMHAIEQHTPQNYIAINSKNPNPGEVAITTGLTRISLHFAIAHLEHLGVPKSTLDWMANERSKGRNAERATTYREAENLKEAIRTAGIDLEFISHMRKSVTC